MPPPRPRCWLIWTLGLTSCLTGAGRAGEPAAADLAAVPADALGFVHVRLADIWRSEHFKPWRATVLKAGEEALAAFDRRFIPAPSSVERVTVVVVAPSPVHGEPQVFAILHTSKAIDREAFF